MCLCCRVPFSMGRLGGGFVPHGGPPLDYDSGSAASQSAHRSQNAAGDSSCHDLKKPMLIIRTLNAAVLTDVNHLSHTLLVLIVYIVNACPEYACDENATNIILCLISRPFTSSSPQPPKYISGPRVSYKNFVSYCFAN